MKSLLRVVSLSYVAVLLSVTATAQTNVQAQYDFDRQCLTSTLEMFKADGWGSSFFFVDYDYALSPSVNTMASPSGTYFEISRALNFWKDSPVRDFSLHLEYNGGFGISLSKGVSYGGYPVNHAFLAGVDYSFPFKGKPYTLSLQILYKKIVENNSLLPMQFSAVWGWSDIFGVPGLRFSGFADVWFQNSVYGSVMARTKFISEPQLWYNVGRFFGVDNLNVGGEVELTVNFTDHGFRCRPCLGVKWDF